MCVGISLIYPEYCYFPVTGYTVQGIDMGILADYIFRPIQESQAMVNIKLASSRIVVRMAKS
jgi:hypothetical protein